MTEETRAPLVAQTPAQNAATLAPTTEGRERSVEILTRHFAVDRIPMDEFERRVQLAYRAVSVAELDALTSDLEPVQAQQWAMTDVAPVEGEITAIFSSNERRGSARVPKHLKVVAIFGNVELDFRRATFSADNTEIEVSAFFGNVEITLPPDVRLEIEGTAIVGAFGASGRGEQSSLGATKVVRVRGRAVLANVETTVRAVRELAGDSDQRKITG